jgi:excisionase family DNA binding protein
MTDLDVAEAARALGVTERTIRRWLKDGRLAGLKVGGRIRIPERAVLEVALPYGSAEGEGPAVGVGRDPDVDAVVRWLSGPDRLRERRARAARLMDEIRASSRPPSDATDMSEALVRAAREDWDERVDRIVGPDRP